MRLFKKVAIVSLAVLTSFAISASGGMKHNDSSYENKADAALNAKLVELKHKIKEQRAGIQEATDLFKKVIPSALEGSANVKRVWFEQGSTSLVITDSPIPIKIFFKGQFLMENPMLTDKVGKDIKFKLSNVELAEEPILHTLRIPMTDSPYWIYATFSNYGKASEGDFVDNLKNGSIPY